MFQFFFAFLLGAHGFFHMTGFAKAANPAGLEGLTMPVSKGFGTLWMTCAFLFIAAAGTFLSRKDWWWLLALAAVLLSQYLIFQFWSDARYGTVVNMIVVVAVVVGAGQWHFRRTAMREVASLHDVAGNASVVVDEAMIDPLPPLVGTWLRRAGVVGQPLTRTARLRQSGEMRTDLDGAWMPFTAEQWFSVERPGFVWLAEISAAPGVHIAGCDVYREGRGRMRIKAMSLIPLANSTGPEIDQGALVRYLAEMIWLPSAALRGNVRWTQDDEASATAILTDGGQSVSARFTFDVNGDPINVDAKRYYTGPAGTSLEHWHITVDPGSYVTYQGLRVPARASVTWKLPVGDFEWYHVVVEGAVYNRGAADT